MHRVAVIGAGRCDEPTAALAEEAGRLLAERGVLVVCGGLGGVMEAACRGAKSAGGLTVGILPGNDSCSANPWVDIPVVTGLSEARNIIVVRSAEVVLAIAGEYGTLSELAFALKLGIPVVGLNSWQLGRDGQIETHFPQAKTAREAVNLCLGLLGLPSSPGH